MISITERLRARHEPVGDGTGTWRPDGLCQEAADTIDALVEALEGGRAAIEASEWHQDSWGKWKEIYVAMPAIERIDAALSKAKGKQE